MNRAGAQAMLFQTGRWPAPWFRKTTSLAVSVAPAQVDGDRRAVAGDAAALGPGDHVRTAIRAGWRIDHAQHRDALAQQPDRDGAAAAAFQERPGAVMRIDNPAIAVCLRGQHAFFLADEAGRQQCCQVFAQKQFDLGVDRRRVGSCWSAARPAG